MKLGVCVVVIVTGVSAQFHVDSRMHVPAPQGLIISEDDLVKYTPPDAPAPTRVTKQQPLSRVQRTGLPPPKGTQVYPSAFGGNFAIRVRTKRFAEASAQRNTFLQDLIPTLRNAPRRQSISPSYSPSYSPLPPQGPQVNFGGNFGVNGRTKRFAEAPAQRTTFVQDLIARLRNSPRRESISPSYNNNRREFDLIGTGRLNTGSWTGRLNTGSWSPGPGLETLTAKS